MDSLLIKLPGEVSDTSLKKINEFQLNMSGEFASTAPNGNSFYIILNSGSGNKIARIVSGEAHFTDQQGNEDYGKSASISDDPSGTRLYVSGGTAKVYLDVKDNLSSFSTSQYSNRRNIEVSEDLFYSDPRSLELWNTRIVGKFFIKYFSRINNIVLSNVETTEQSIVTTEDINDAPALNSVHIKDGNIIVSGSLINFERTGFTRLRFTSEQVEGSVEGLVEQWWSAGKRSGDCNLQLSETSCKFNQQDCPSDLNLAFSSVGVAVKDGNNVLLGNYNGYEWTYSN